MKIHKIGHCCLHVQLKNLSILTDPGAFSTDQDKIKEIDIILITHEHADHLHVDSLKNVLVNNPNAKIITNSGVGKVLDGEGITYELLDGTDTTEVNGVLFEAFDAKHEEIYEELGQVQNTGYFIANKLFYPGDSFKNPDKEVDILALPVAGPWCKIGDAVRYALEIKPKKAFPVHEGMIKEDIQAAFHKIPEIVLAENGIGFVSMVPGDTKEF